MNKLPSKGPNSPFSVGLRTLVARTCTKCGRLSDADSFPVIVGVGARRRVCHLCVNAQKKRDREQRGIGLPPSRVKPPEDQQTQRRTQWSAEDDAYLRDNVGKMTYEALAVALGRSMAAVYKRRDILGIPAVRKRHRVAHPWKIK